MTHEETLTLLLPVELTGDHPADIALEGLELDAAQAEADRLLVEMFPDGAVDLLPDWERVYGLTPSATDPIQYRQARVIMKMRELGGLSRAYFIALAASLGWTITIDELTPFECGVDRCGDRLYIEAIRFIWRVNVSGSAVYRFRCGQSACGEPLTGWIPNAALQTILEELKPAHTYIIYNYDAESETYWTTPDGETITTPDGEPIEINIG